MTNSSSPAPDPAFTAALEWQLRRELRRDAVTPSQRTRPKAFTLIAVALASGLAGAACLGAALQVQESRRGQVIIAGLTFRESAAKQAADVARQMVKNVQAMRNAGTITNAEVRRAAARADAADAALHITQLELAEARVSSQQPRQDLSAPKVNGRDFIFERLRIEQEQAETAAAAAEEFLLTARQRAAAGLTTMAEAADAQLAVDVCRQATAEIANRIALREKFIAGAIAPQLTERQDLQAHALAVQNTAQAKLDAARQMLDRTIKLRDAGTVSTAELTEAQLTVANLQVELEIAKAQLAALQATP